MISQNEVVILKRENAQEDTPYCAFVIDNEVVRVCGITSYFYGLLTSGYNILENLNSTENEYLVDFLDSEGNLIDTLQCDEELSAIVRSNPSLFVIFYGNGPDSIEDLGWKRYISIGWTVSDEGEFNVPLGWTGVDIPELPQRIS